jgi:hypothetical protein
VIKLPQFQPFGRGEPRAPQAHRIQAADAVVSARDRVGWKILADRRTALHERQGAHPDELVDQAVARDKSPVVDADMAPQQCPVRDDYQVPNPAIVPHMSVRHQKIA